MSQPVHTPAPAQLPTGFESVTPDEHEGLPLFADGDPFNTIAFVVPRRECNANARLLAAAYNAFDSAGKRLGCNAVELAERMQDGGIYELFHALTYAFMLIEEPAEGTNQVYAEAALRKAREAIAKVKGARP